MNHLRLFLAVACLLMTLSAPASACPRCRVLVRAGVFNSHFVPMLAETLLPLAVLALVCGGAYFADGREREHE